MPQSMKLFEVQATLGVKHLVVAKSEGHAVQVVTKSLAVRSDGLEARLVHALAQPGIVRSDYPDDD